MPFAYTKFVKIHLCPIETKRLNISSWTRRTTWKNLSKTVIKEYHERDFNQLLELHKKNRNKVSIDLSDRKTQELLENQFTKSLLILEPLKARIKATDELRDEIVYRLFGLAEKEIKVVKGEGSLTLLR